LHLFLPTYPIATMEISIYKVNDLWPIAWSKQSDWKLTFTNQRENSEGTNHWRAYNNKCWCKNKRFLDEISCLSIDNLRFFLNRETKLKVINSSDQIIWKVKYFNYRVKTNTTTRSSITLIPIHLFLPTYTILKVDISVYEINRLWLIVWNKGSNWKLALTNGQKNFEHKSLMGV